MPLIPTLGPSNALPNLPGPVLDRERRPTVNNSELSAAVGALGKSARMPMLPDSLADGFEGVAALGRSISRFGNTAAAAIGALAEKRAEAEIYNDVTAADTELRVAYEQFEAKKASLQPKDWNKAFTDTVRPVMDRITSDKKLHPQAREKIQTRAASWYKIHDAQVFTEGARAEFEIAKNNALGGINNAIESRDEKAFEEYIATGKKSGWLYPHIEEQARIKWKQEGERLEKKVRADALDKASSEVSILARGSGYEAATAHVKRLNIPEADKEPLLSEARRIAAQERSDLADRLSEEVLTGAISNKERVKERMHGNPHATSKLEAELVGMLSDQTKAAITADRETNGVRNAVELRQSAKDYNRTKDPTGEQYETLRREIYLRVPEGNRNAALDILEAKYSGKAIPAPEPITKMKDAFLDSAYDPVGGIIKWKRKETKTLPDGRKQTEEVIFDDTARDRAFSERAEVEQMWSNFVRDHPEDAKDPQKGMKALKSFLPAGAMGDALDAAVKSAQATPEEGPLDDDLIASVKALETFIPKAYGDYKQTSVGYGTRAKHSGEVLTETEADKRLRAELSDHAGRIDNAAAKVGLKLTKGQRNALISFDFNTGQGAHLIESSGGNLEEIKQRIPLYKKAGGQELPGLVNRRKKELAIFES